LIDPTKAQPTVEIEFDEDSLPPIGSTEMVEVESDTPPNFGGDLIFEQVDEPTDDYATEISELSTEDQALAEQQKVCPVSNLPLGSMGAPIKVMLGGKPVFICCERCRRNLLAEPTKYLAKLERKAVR